MRERNGAFDLFPGVNFGVVDLHRQFRAALARAFERIEDGDEAVVVARGSAARICDRGSVRSRW
jgi:hypothetical protein